MDHSFPQSIPTTETSTVHYKKTELDHAIYLWSLKKQVWQHRFILIKDRAGKVFLLTSFGIKRPTLVPIDMPKSDFEFSRIFVGLFVFDIQYCIEIDSPLWVDNGESKTKP